MRYFEGLVHAPVFGAMNGPVARPVVAGPVYDLDEIAAYCSLEEGRNWDPVMLPVIEPPHVHAPVMADFDVPEIVLEQARELQETGGMAVAEEHLEGFGADRLAADRVGAFFSRVEGRRDELSERRLQTLARWRREEPDTAQVYRALIIAARWETRESGSNVLLEEASYDWLFSVREDGSPLGRADLELPDRDLRAAPESERAIWKYAATQLLMPFLTTFALLACENVSAEPVPAYSEQHAPPPRYVRPVLRPLVRAAYGRYGRYARWELGALTTRPTAGRFAKLEDSGETLPEGYGPGLYWIEEDA